MTSTKQESLLASVEKDKRGGSSHSLQSTRRCRQRLAICAATSQDLEWKHGLFGLKLTSPGLAAGDGKGPTTASGTLRQEVLSTMCFL